MLGPLADAMGIRTSSKLATSTRSSGLTGGDPERPRDKAQKNIAKGGKEDLRDEILERGNGSTGVVR